jgi:hypothetical protein
MENMELVYASDIEEFFYEDSNEAVQDGDPVGVEWDELVKAKEPVIHFTLFKNIYWSPNNEAEEEI